MKQAPSDSVTPIDLTDCDREPIHVPGAIQPHGVLFALASETLEILHVSENVVDLLQMSPSDLLGQSITRILDPEDAPALSELLKNANQRFVNPLQIPIRIGSSQKFFDAVVHQQGGWTLVELENPASESEARRPERIGVDHYFDLVQQTLDASTEKESLEDFCGVIADIVRNFLGFDRVMIYQFARDGHGLVIAESRVEEVETYLGLHFPASDIPQQARRLYALNWIRLIPDVEYTPAQIVSTDETGTEVPLDLSFSTLRSVSPIHVQYLKNMGVSASMSISLLKGGDLWGLIACHHRVPRHVPYTNRAACVMLGTVISSLIISHEQKMLTQDQTRRQLLNSRLMKAVAGTKDVGQGLSETAEDLLNLVNAQGVAICFGGKIVLQGITPTTDFVVLLCKTLDKMSDEDILVTDCLSEWLDEARECTDVASGLIALQFWPGDYLLFFRGEMLRTVRWAGNPNKAVTRDSLDQLTPRQSFAEWAETVEKRSAHWSELDLIAARELRHSLAVHVIRPSQQLQRINRQLVAKNRELEQFVYSVSHDLKAPLVTCKGFVGVLKTDIEQENYEMLLDSANRIEQATTDMNLLIDDLLQFSRVGRASREVTTVDLNELASELQEKLGPQFKQAGVTCIVEEALPSVKADRREVRRVLDNLIGNALKYATAVPNPTVTIGGHLQKHEALLFVRDNGPGIEEEHHERIFEIFQRVESEKPGTGIGLAIVRKIMQTNEGRCWVESKLEAGATFWLAFPRGD